ncbi:heme exporter protein CcmB [Marinomonas epiphytica]
MTYRQFILSEGLLLMRRKQAVVNGLLLFVMVVCLFPLGVSPEVDFLRLAAPGIIWCAVLVAVLLVTQGMFVEDWQDGSIAQWLLSDLSIFALVSIKTGLNWLAVIAPICVFSPGLALLLHFPSEAIWLLVATLLLGTPCLFYMASIGAALTVTLKQGVVLHLLVILPFFLPVLIFASSALQEHDSGLYVGQLLLLAALSLFSGVFAPWLTATLLKGSVN